MKIADLDQVTALVRKGEEIKALIVTIKTRPDALNISITGTYMNDDMIALVKPVIIRELSARYCEIERRLQQLGVNLA